MYSADEENWLQGKLRIFDECWNRVPVSDDLVSEFVMFTYDVPLSKNFVPAHLAVFNERYLLMMKMHSEFTNLNGFEQEKLWKKNILYGSAMNLVKLECCKGGKEQWHFVYPTYLNETWKGKNILGQKNIKKIDMDIANSFSGKFTITLRERDVYFSVGCLQAYIFFKMYRVFFVIIFICVHIDKHFCVYFFIILVS